MCTFLFLILPLGTYYLKDNEVVKTKKIFLFSLIVYRFSSDFVIKRLTDRELGLVDQ